MPKIEPFEQHIDQYEDWFVKNCYAFRSEVNAIRRHLPEAGRGLEIGVGSGLFASPLGIGYGVEPSARMRTEALKRGVDVVDGVAEALPMDDDFCDYALMVTTICFLDDVPQSLAEARRVIKPDGKLIVGLVDKNSPLGKLYQLYQDQNVFYRHAVFYSTEEVVAMMKEAGFHHFYFTQTIFRMLEEIEKDEEVREGYSEGSFVVISAINGK